jgi:nucleotide-binding universal stress UspA family protein
MSSGAPADAAYGASAAHDGISARHPHDNIHQFSLLIASKESLVLMAGECDDAVEKELRLDPSPRHKQELTAMSTKIIVSYDGTNNEDDAIALGRVFARAGAEVALAYVRHTHEPEPDREVLVEHEAEALLARGAELLGDPDIPRHVVADRSTPEGLRALAEREGADAIVFCSDSHTAPRHVSIGNSAQRLLDGGRFAIAVAGAGLAEREQEPVRRIAVTEDPTDPSAQDTAHTLALALGATVAPASPGHDGDLLVLGSRPEAGQGQVALSAASLNLIEDAPAVLVVPRGVALSFVATAPAGA